MNGERVEMRIRKLLTAAIAAGALLAGIAVAPAQAATTVKMILWPGPEGEAMQKVVDAYNAGQGKKRWSCCKASFAKPR